MLRVSILPLFVLYLKAVIKKRKSPRNRKRAKRYTIK